MFVKPIRAIFPAQANQQKRGMGMSHLEEWAKMIAKQLKSEAELVSTQAKSEL